MNKKTKEEIYAKLYDSATYLLMNHESLPKSIEKTDLRLNKKEREKIKDIIWFIAHSKLWK